MLEINLKKDMQDIYTENYKTLWKTKENPNKWKYVTYSDTQNSAQRNLKSQCNPNEYLSRNWWANYKVHMEMQGTYNGQIILKEERHCW